MCHGVFKAVIPQVQNQLRKEKQKVYAKLLQRITDNDAIEDFIEFLLSQYEDVSKVTLNIEIEWKVENG